MKLRIFFLIALLGAPSLPVFSANYTRHQEPNYLTFDELLKLSQDSHPGGKLQEKLEKFWRTPIINNEAFYRGAKPNRPQSKELGPVLSVASWNIEKSLQMPKVIEMFQSPAAFEEMIDRTLVGKNSQLEAKIKRQRDRLLLADVLILQEIDIGVKRSGYINAAEELATALNMNYAYATEQLEIDPVVMGTEAVTNEEGVEDKKASEEFVADPKRYKGLFGQAVLSRYPIKHVEVFQLKNKAYDWFWGEKYKLAFFEKTRRFGTRALFKNELTREMKVGGRVYFRVDLDVPEAPGGTVTIINIHLEIKCPPKARQKQIEEILSYIKSIENPVIVMGDFNSASTDLSPTSVTRTVKRTAKNPTTWLGAAVSYLHPQGLALNTTRGVSNVTKNFQNPLAKSIPVIAPNPQRGMFKGIQNFRFEDGGVFDFRGDYTRSITRKNGTLGNSNQLDFKGFKTTFRVKRPIGPLLGKLRLDWVFVKVHLSDPEAEGPYEFAPHFGETLEELNTLMYVPFSDHHPNVVDLPFEEPSAGKNL